MTQFFSSEISSLEKQVKIDQVVKTPPDKIDEVYEVQRCVDWITSNNFKKVCLQFPDHLLADSTELALRLKKILKQTVYVLGDTTYQSCCLDYIAAAHVNGDAIIHYGPICFSKPSGQIQSLNIYEKHDISIDSLKKCFLEKFTNYDENVLVIVDTHYIHKLNDILHSLECFKNLKLQRVDDEEFLGLDNSVTVFVSNDERKILNFYLVFHPKTLYQLKTSSNGCELEQYKEDKLIFKRRNYLVEKVKDSKTIGIVVATLAVKNYLKVLDRLKKLIRANHKKYYIISVGKPTVAKLANLQEIDIYVMITCAMYDIYDSREFFKPIVTPFDVEMALNPKFNIYTRFSYDYNTYLDTNDDIDIEVSNEADVSLLTNAIRSSGQEEVTDESQTDNQIALKAGGTLAVSSNYGAGFLADRSWKGLEQNLGQTEPARVEEGRCGTASGYKSEGGV